MVALVSPSWRTAPQSLFFPALVEALVLRHFCRVFQVFRDSDAACRVFQGLLADAPKADGSHDPTMPQDSRHWAMVRFGLAGGATSEWYAEALTVTPPTRTGMDVDRTQFAIVCIWLDKMLVLKKK